MFVTVDIPIDQLFNKTVEERKAIYEAKQRDLTSAYGHGVISVTENSDGTASLRFEYAEKFSEHGVVITPLGESQVAAIRVAVEVLAGSGAVDLDGDIDDANSKFVAADPDDEDAVTLAGHINVLEAMLAPYEPSNTMAAPGGNKDAPLEQTGNAGAATLDELAAKDPDADEAEAPDEDGAEA